MGYGFGFGTWRRRGGGFSPDTALFGSGEQGYIIPWLPGTVWKDTARTIPCTAHDDLIARADDISGRGNHFVQPVESKRFKWQTDGTYYWALPDAFDDFMSTVSAVPLSASDKLTIWAGFRKLSDAKTGIFLETSPSALSVSYPGSAAFVFPAADASPQLGFSPRGSSAIGGRNTTTIGAAPLTLVASCAFDIAGASLDVEIKPRVNGAVPGLVNAGSTIGGGSFGNYVHYLGARSGTSLFFNGRIGPLIARGGATSAELIAATEQWVNSKTGAY